jgi:hypothetical protein
MTALTRRVVAPLAVLAALLLAACGDADSTVSFPDREPDARGTLLPNGQAFPSGDESEAALPFFTLVADESDYPYFVHALLFFDGDTAIGSTTGQARTLDDITSDMMVEVWTDACQESFPVRCVVTHARLPQVD